PLPLADASLLGALAPLSERLRRGRLPDGQRGGGRRRHRAADPALRLGADGLVAGCAHLRRGRSRLARRGRGAGWPAHVAGREVRAPTRRSARLALALPLLQLLPAPAVRRHGCGASDLASPLTDRRRRGWWGA